VQEPRVVATDFAYEDLSRIVAGIERTSAPPPLELLRPNPRIVIPLITVTNGLSDSDQPPTTTSTNIRRGTLDSFNNFPTN
jgi:hypothetical protein